MARGVQPRGGALARAGTGIWRPVWARRGEFVALVPDPDGGGDKDGVGHGMEIETCGVCGGDGRVGNAFGGETARCPGCNGTGRRSFEPLFRDVTKTKPSHHRQASQASAAQKKDTPTTASGMQLAKEVRASSLPEATQEKLVREIVEHEASHGRLTQTFTKKVRKQIRAATPDPAR